MNSDRMPNTVCRVALGLWGLCVPLVFCSCQGPSHQAAAPGMPGAGMATVAGHTEFTDTVPCPAYAMCPQPIPCGPPGMEQGIPLPYAPMNECCPAGFSGEYLCDGGDACFRAEVTRTGDVRGLEMEDTVAHFDTLDGRTLVQPTNRVCVYAPRFGAARQVVSLIQNEQANGAAGIAKPLRLSQQEYARGPSLSTQNLQPTPEIGTKSLTIYQLDRRAGAMSTAVKAKAFQDAFQPYESVTLIRTGQMIEAEGPMLAKSAQAAIPWSKTQAVQVILDRQAAAAETKNQNVHAVYTVNKPPSCPRLRVCKVASTPFAEPGDIISFTIRFDNVGNEAIGNVTIVDNLTTRLEYVPDSAQSSVDTQFFSQANEGGSLVLRWELDKPLEVGQGGVLRFNCRVR